VTSQRHDVNAIEDSIEMLGLRHRITTRRTSLVAISEEPSVDPTAPRRRRRLEVELPAGVSAEGVGLQGAMYASVAKHAVSPETMAVCRLSSHRVMGGGPSRGPGGQGANKLPQPSPPVIRLDGRVLRIDDDLLVVEFETPEDGIMLPPDGEDIYVTTVGGYTSHGLVEGTVSTQPGPHDRGLTLRLGLRTTDGTDWPDNVREMAWPAPDGTVYILSIEPRE
jgi:hypothetical protein